MKPDWTSAAWWATTLTQLVAVIVGLGALIHPGFSVGPNVSAVVPAVSVLAAAIATAVYSHGHHAVVIAQAKAATPPVLIPVAPSAPVAPPAATMVTVQPPVLIPMAPSAPVAPPPAATMETVQPPPVAVVPPTAAQTPPLV